MRYYSVKNTEMSAIADAIRVKTGKADGMTPAQMSEEISNIPEQIEVEEVITPLNMADGDMTVLPTDGKAISKVVIQKPETLTPENIAKDVDIAGVVGTLEGGGSSENGEMAPFLFVSYKTNAENANKAAMSTTQTTYLYLLDNAKVICGYGLSGSTTGSYIAPDIARFTPGRDGIAYTYKKAVYYSNAKHLILNSAFILFSVPGVYLQESDGVKTLYADETITGMNLTSTENVRPVEEVSRIDLSKTTITYLSSKIFSDCKPAEVLLPPTLTNITYGTLEYFSACVFDFSRHTTVPTLVDFGRIPSGDALEIRVPSALYNNWKTATNWSNWANYIVPV